jgi:nucleoside-diphosphate-sugar epimerase
MDAEFAASDGRITLLTGATGFLGRELLASLLASRPDERLLLPIRPSRRSPADRLAELLEHSLADPDARADAARRVRALPFDLTRDDPAFAEAVAAAVDGRRWRVIHGAASVAFDLPLHEARAINVEGTRRLLELADALAPRSRFEGFHYVSTAFVAGDRAGLVREDELDCGQGFSNSYERSKLEAERLVSSYRERLPLCIFRPSIVAGHSTTGRTTSYKVLYWPLKAFARRLVVCIPGDPEACYDIVPVDFVTEALLHLAEHGDCAGRTYHLTAGRTVTLQRAVELAAEFFEVRRVPPFVSPRRFYAVMRPLLWLTLVGPARRVLQVSDVYIPYLSRKLVFDNTNAAEALRGASIAVPDAEAYLKTVFHFARQTDFGRRPDGAGQL